MGFLTVDFLIKAVVLGGAAFVIWRMLQPKYEVRIVLTPEGVQHLSGVAQAQRREVEEFLQENLPDRGKIIIGGVRGPGGRVRFIFRGAIDGGKQQRFRNYFSVLF